MGFEGGCSVLFAPKRGRAARYAGKDNPPSSSSSSSSSLDVSSFVSNDKLLEGVECDDEDWEELKEPARRSVYE